MGLRELRSGNKSSHPPFAKRGKRRVLLKGEKESFAGG
jgi:hypothetical protein